MRLYTKARPARFAHRRRGTAAVEMALVAPLLGMIVVGMIELSRGWDVKEILNNAARKGCRTGILPQKANSDITADVNNILTDNGLPTGSVTVTVLVNGVAVDASTAVQNDQISVKVSIPTSQTYWISQWFLSGSTIESETIVMMRQA